MDWLYLGQYGGVGIGAGCIYVRIGVLVYGLPVSR
jgi:hypothetical protein